MSVRPDFRKSLAEYWEDPKTLSILDKNLHQLEIDTVCQYLRPNDFIADIGCGDARATIEYAKRVRKSIGFERSNYLRNKAINNVKKAGIKNIAVEKGDILQLPDISVKFDSIITQRVLINLASWEEQRRAISCVYDALKTGGLYIMIENTEDAFVALNNMRAEIGMEPIPKHWHNLFFDYEQLMRFLKNKFKLLTVHDFGLYYFLTRVYTQMFASFKGCGKNAVCDPVFTKSDKAARIIYEKFHERIHIGGCRALGPIQVFVLRKIDIGKKRT